MIRKGIRTLLLSAALLAASLAASLGLSACIAQQMTATKQVSSSKTTGNPMGYPAPGAEATGLDFTTPRLATARPDPTFAAENTNEPANQAIQDLAERLEIQASSIQVIRIQSDEFPADNLGCPGPGVTPLPIPAIVSGTVILLEVEGKQYTYHARARQVIFCGPWE